MGGKRITFARKVQIGQWNMIAPKRPRSNATRQCENCGCVFTLPLVKMGRNRDGSILYTISKRRSCSARCARDMQSTAIMLLHENALAQDPAAYKDWLDAVRSNIKRKNPDDQPPARVPRSPL